VDNCEYTGCGLTRSLKGRIFNQLTSAFGHPLIFRLSKLGFGAIHNEQENFSAKQPSSLQGARFSSSHAHPRWAGNLGRPPPQGSYRTLCVTHSLTPPCPCAALPRAA
jgi:hypothetical protein